MISNRQFEEMGEALYNEGASLELFVMEQIQKYYNGEITKAQLFRIISDTYNKIFETAEENYNRGIDEAAEVMEEDLKFGGMLIGSTATSLLAIRKTLQNKDKKQLKAMKKLIVKSEKDLKKAVLTHNINLLINQGLPVTDKNFKGNLINQLRKDMRGYTHNQATKNMVNAGLKLGVDTWIVSGNRGLCDLCKPWNGMELDKKGVEYAKKCGLFHYNCRCSLNFKVNGLSGKDSDYLNKKDIKINYLLNNNKKSELISMAEKQGIDISDLKKYDLAKELIK